MLKFLIEMPFNRSLPIHLVGAVASVLFFGWAKNVLDASYAASKHPVDYATGQTTFSGEKIKQYYAHMSEQGTLDIYWQTQLIDYSFIIGMFCVGQFFCSLVARLGREGSWGRFLGKLAGGAIILGALSDAIENAWSFIMIADPSNFANWLALPYSGFAVLKFALITVGMLCLILCVLTGLAGRALRKPKLG